MTAFARSWRHSRTMDGPHPATTSDIAALNRVFSEAFTDRYRKDGLVGVRVPNLGSAIWRFAIEDAAGGAMLWRGERDEVVAFNVAHLSGIEGWMGPLAVDPEYQGHGAGKAIVTAALQWLTARSARVMGLETMPRTMDNIGFYSSLGFTPGALTMTLTLAAAHADSRVPQLGRLGPAERDDAIAQCGALTHELLPGYDFTRELRLTEALSLGDTLLLERGSDLDGFAITHSVPLVDGRAREELRVLKLVARTEADFEALLTQLADYARRCQARRVAVRLQGAYPELYRRMIRRGARVRWTDLRMSADGFAERRPEHGLVLSNWEI